MRPVSSKVILLTLFLFSCKVNTGTNNKKKTVAVQFEWLIDTAAVVTREDVLAAAAQLGLMNKSYNMERDPNERGLYYRILQARTFLHQKMAQILDTIPGQEREPFLRQFNALMPE